MSTHCSLNAVVGEMDARADGAVVKSQLMVLRNEMPVSIASLSFITQRAGSRWLIDRRLVRSRPGSQLTKSKVDDPMAQKRRHA